VPKKLINKHDLDNFFTELLSDIVGINPYVEQGPSKWALIARVARQISLLEKKTEESKEAFDRVLRSIQQFDMKPIWPLAQQIDFLVKEKEKLEETVVAVKNTIRDLEENKNKGEETQLQVQVLQEKLNELKHVLKSKEDSIAGLENDLKTLSDEHKEANDSIKKLENALGNTNKNVEDEKTMDKLMKDLNLVTINRHIV